MIVDQLVDETFSQVRPFRRQFERLRHPFAGFFNSRRRRQKTCQTGNRTNVFGILFDPILIVSHQSVLVTRSKKDLFNAAPHVAEQPARWIQIGQQFFKVSDAFVALAQSNLQLGSFDIESHPAIIVFDQSRKFLISRQREFVFALFDHRDGDLFLDSCIIRENFLQTIPNFQRLFGSLGSLMNAAQLPKDLQHVGAARLALDRAFKSCDCFFRLSDQQQTLTHVVTRQCVVGSKLFCLRQRINRIGIFAAMRFKHPQQHPRCSVFRILLRSIPQPF